MSKHRSVRTIRLGGDWTGQTAQEFGDDFKQSLRNVAQQIPVGGFSRTNPVRADLDFYQVEIKRLTPKRAVGVIHVSVIDRPRPEQGVVPPEKDQHVRFGFELDRQNGQLRLGRGFLRT